MVFDLRQVIRQWATFGVLDVVVPFILFFTIMFAALQKTKVLGGGSKAFKEYEAESNAAKKKILYAAYTGKKYNIIVALVISLLAIIPHVMWGGRPDDGKMRIGSTLFPDPVEVINNSLPAISVWVVAVLMVMLILGLFGAKFEFLGWPLAGWVALGSFLVVVYVFGAASSLWEVPKWARYWGLGNPSTQFGLLMILVFAIVIYMIVKEPGTTTDMSRGKDGKFSAQHLPKAVEDLFR